MNEPTRYCACCNDNSVSIPDGRELCHWCQRAADEARAEVERLQRIIAAAKFTGRYWIESIMREEALRATGMSHPVACMMAALDGETDPISMGIASKRWDDFAAAVDPSFYDTHAGDAQ